MFKTINFRLGKVVGLISLFLILGAVQLAAAVEARVMIVSGFFNFRQTEFRELYGKMPLLGISFDLFASNNLGLGIGAYRCAGQGEALTLSGEPVLYPIKFYRWTFPLLFKYRVSLGRFQMPAGAGLAFSVYDESWVGVDLSYPGQKFHFRGELGADYRLAGRLLLRAGLSWDSIPTGIHSLLVGGQKVNLAGLSIQGGLGFKL